MKQAILLNFGILIVIGIALIQLQNPLALLGLLLLKDLPYGLLVQQDDEEEEESQPIGFIQ